MYPQQGGGNEREALEAAMLMAALQEEQEKAKRAKFFEAVLPVALLAILAAIFAVKMGWINLSAIPFFSQPIDIVILTDNPNAVNIQNLYALLSKEATYYQLKVRVLQLKDRFYVSQLSNADIVILYQTGSQGTSQTAYKVLSERQRKELAKYLSRGGKMIVVLDSGTWIPRSDILRFTDTSTGETQQQYYFVGWWLLEDYIPVECPATGEIPSESSFCFITEEEKSTIPTGNATLATIDIEHPIMKGFEKINIGETMYLNGVQPAPNGYIVADLEVELDSGKISYPGVTIGQGITGTNVVHFNFQPELVRSVTINTILWLAGRG